MPSPAEFPYDFKYITLHEAISVLEDLYAECFLNNSDASVLERIKANIRQLQGQCSG